MANTNELKLIVLTPSKKLVEAACDDVYFPSSEGVLGILPGHAALVTQVGTGVLHYTHDNMTSFLTVMGGVAEVRENVVTLLVDVAEDASTIDLARAEKALERSHQRLAGKDQEIDMPRAMVSAARAKARIDAATRLLAGKR
jgi:F-type H+-transporting ATPase subunit epsilon